MQPIRPIRPAVVGAFALTLVLGGAGVAQLGGSGENLDPPASTSQLPPLTIPSEMPVEPTSTRPRPSADARPPSSPAPTSAPAAADRGLLRPPAAPERGVAERGVAEREAAEREAADGRNTDDGQAGASRSGGEDNDRAAPPTTTSPPRRRPMTEQEMRDALCESYGQPPERCEDPDD